MLSSIQILTINYLSGAYYTIDSTTTGNVFTPSLSVSYVTISASVSDGQSVKGYTALGNEASIGFYIYDFPK
jgi:hypothetical protein